MIKYGNKYDLWMGAVCIALIDQLTKILAINHLKLHDEITLNSMFSFLRIYNESYIMLDYNVFEGKYALSSMIYFQLIYVSIAAILMYGIIWVIKQPAFKNENCWGREFAKSGLFLIVGGMLGNVTDRVFRKEGVVDFIQLNVLTESYPIFNIADVMIFMGEFCLIVAWVIILSSHIVQKVKSKKIKKDNHILTIDF